MGCTALFLLVTTLGGVVVGSSMSSFIITIRYAQGSSCTDPYRIAIATIICTPCNVHVDMELAASGSSKSLFTASRGAVRKPCFPLRVALWGRLSKPQLMRYTSCVIPHYTDMPQERTTGAPLRSLLCLPTVVMLQSTLQESEVYPGYM